MRTSASVLVGVVALSLSLFGLAACGGGGGGGGTPDAAFVTADPRGLTRAGDVGGALPGVGGANGADLAPSAPGAEAADAGGEVARELAEADL
ncbi:MAG: hypothetical protein JNM10_13965, partial [Planctomycetia bacterium]|nr:hypothetical protein [Planctomycetia bacterium]